MIQFDKIRPISALISDWAARTPDRMAYADRARRVTYAQLDRETRSFAAGLRDMGLQPGTPVAIWLPNSVDLVVALFGAMRAGCPAVPMSYEALPYEMAYRVRDSGAAVLVTRFPKRKALAELGDDTPLQHLIITDKPDAGEQSFKDMCAAEAPALPDDDIDAVSLLLYTSGTTGEPKGVMLTSRAILWSNAAAWAPILGMTQDDTIMTALPLYHAFGISSCVTAVLANGAGAYLIHRFTPSEMMKLLPQEKPTILPGVPTMFHHLLAAARAGQTAEFDSLRACVSAGSIMSAALMEEFEDKLGVQMLDGLGMTEASSNITLNWPGSKKIPGSCGLPILGMAIRIVDVDTGIDCPPGVEGELTFRGPNMMLGYHNKPEATAKAIKGGWYHSGDMGVVDEHGFLTVTGRLKELIIRGGENLPPAEIEDVIKQMPGIQDAAVAGAPDEEYGEIPIAFVIPDPGVTPSNGDVAAFCKGKLSVAKLPAATVIVDEIPRTGSGKVMRFKLSDFYKDLTTKAS